MSFEMLSEFLSLNELLTVPAILSLLTVSFMGVVLGIDNVVFIAVVAKRAPKGQEDRARTLGIIMAMVARKGEHAERAGHRLWRRAVLHARNEVRRPQDAHQGVATRQILQILNGGIALRGVLAPFGLRYLQMALGSRVVGLSPLVLRYELVENGTHGRGRPSQGHVLGRQAGGRAPDALRSLADARTGVGFIPGARCWP